MKRFKFASHPGFIVCKSQKGFTLLQVMVGSVISGALIVSAAKLVVTVVEVKFESEATVILSSLKSQFSTVVKLPGAWDNTFAKMAAADATGTFTACMASNNAAGVDCENQMGPLALWDSDDRPFYSHFFHPLMIDPIAGNISGNANSGFGLSGQPCTTFKLPDQSFSCPYQVQAYWRTECNTPGTPCIIPTRNIAVYFIVDYGAVRNASKMKRNFLREFPATRWADNSSWADNSDSLSFIVVK